MIKELVAEIIYVFQCILSAIFPSYQTEFPVDLIPATFQESQFTGGRRSHYYPESPDPQARYAVIHQFFAEEKEGWSYVLANYAPGYVLKGPGMKINVLRGGIVVQYRKNPNDPLSGTQIFKPVTKPFPKLSDGRK